MKPLSRITTALTAQFACLVIFVGCDDHTTTVRQIQTQRHQQVQAQSRLDHLGEAFNLMERLVELNPDSAQRQIAYHLNQWRQGREQPEALEIPQLFGTISDLVAADQLAAMVERQEFAPGDLRHLRDCYLFRQISQWVNTDLRDDPLLTDWLVEQEAKLGPELAFQLRTASRLFDWTVRNIALEPQQLGSPPLNLPSFPLGMEFEGFGYRQSNYETVWRGTGDSLQRAGVFVQLCRQASLPAFVLAVQDDTTGALTPWSTGVLIGEEIYLFEPELGIFIPGPGQVGVATLAQARSDPTVMRRLNVPGFFEYPLDQQDIQQSTALLNVMPEAVSTRMKLLQSGLTGDQRTTVYVDVDDLAARIDAVSGIAGVRVWRIPLLAEVYRAVLENAASRDPSFSFWYHSRWAILNPAVGASESLARGRWRHLHGVFEDDEVENIKGARTMYLSQRAPEFEIEKLDIDVELQKAYGIRRELGIGREIYERQIIQVQALMRMGKRTATYWLSLVQYDDARYDSARNWLEKRALDDEQRSAWEPAAMYNLGRTAEKLGAIEQAIEKYKFDQSPQQHGNRIRARLLGKQS